MPFGFSAGAVRSDVGEVVWVAGIFMESAVKSEVEGIDAVCPAVYERASAVFVACCDDLCAG